MAQYFPEEFIREVMDRNDIVSTISRYVNLKRSGGSLKGLCPFHKEKTPSFTVSADKQLYYCFGCAKGGTIINFIMQMENLDFVEAVKLLADNAGLDLPEVNQGSNIRSEQRKKIYEMNSIAGRFFYDAMCSDAGANARKYFDGRSLTKSTINRFGLGYAPEGSKLLSHLKSKGFSEDEIILAGLAVKNEAGNVYDRFRNRVMFPIIDVRKNIIGFGGRVLDDSKPKYLNSPDTPAFNKSYNLFGINYAKNTKDDYFILVEGYMDVISLHQHGITSAVATLGTALTPEQARLIGRMKHEVIISYDGDEAGQAATRRAIEILTNEGLSVRVLEMSGYKDPDEYIKALGAGAYRSLAEKSKVQIEYKINKMRTSCDLKTTEGKIRYINMAAAEIANLKSEVERELYAGKLADETGVSLRSIFSEIDRVNAVKQRRESIGDFKNIPSVGGIKSSNPKRENSVRAQKLILNILCSKPETAEEILKKVTEDDFDEGVYREMFIKISECYKSGKPPEARMIVADFEDSSLAAEILESERFFEDAHSAAKDAIQIIEADRKTKSLMKLFEQKKGGGEA